MLQSHFVYWQAKTESRFCRDNAATALCEMLCVSHLAINLSKEYCEVRNDSSNQDEEDGQVDSGLI